MQFLVTAMLVVAAIIHLMPSVGVLGGPRLESLYGLPVDEPDLAILMRHRAVLFGLLGAFLLYAAFQAELQRIAFIAGLLSAGSFVWLAWSIGGYNAQIGRVVIVDLAAIVCLLVAIGADLMAPGRN